MAELSRSQIPPGGWQWYQPQTKWNAPNPISNTFDAQVINIIKHRMANPAIMLRHKLATDKASVGKELVDYTRARLGMGPEVETFPKHPAPPAQPQLGGALSQAVAVVKKMAAGAALLMEWDESGLPPVSSAISTLRASICADCPKNEKGKSLTEYFTRPLAAATQRRFERLQELNLTTPHDDKLQVCQACLCPLRLKVHTPIELIAKRLKPEQRAELDPRCWILTGQ